MIRMLRDDEPLPTGQPRKYRSSHGYVRLRWLIATETYVEAYEHRVVMGRPDAHVHHIDGNKQNNDPANLRIMSATDHNKLHMQQYREARKFKGKARDRERAARRMALDAWWAEIADDYAMGWSPAELGVKYGRDGSNIFRGLRSRGYPMRTMIESSQMRWAKHRQGLAKKEPSSQSQ